MRNKFLKTLLLMLVAFFAIVLVGCGTNEPEKKDDPIDNNGGDNNGGENNGGENNGGETVDKGTYTIKVVDYDGKEIGNKTIEVGKYENVYLALQGEFKTVGSIGDYGAWLVSINDSLCDSNWSLMFYENGQMAANTCDKVAPAKDAVYEFKNECWAAVDYGYGASFDEIDVLLDKVIYNYVKTTLKESVEGTKTYTGSTYWEMLFIDLFKRAGYTASMVDYKFSSELAAEIEAVDVSTLEGANIGKYYSHAKALGKVAEGFASAYETKLSAVESWNDWVTPFVVFPAKDLNSTNEKLAVLASEAITGDTTWGPDGNLWKLTAQALFADRSEALDLKSYVDTWDSKSQYGTNTSNAIVLLAASALNQDVRDTEKFGKFTYNEKEYDYLAYMFAKFYSEELGLMKVTEADTAANASTNQIYCGLLAYKVMRDSKKAANIFGTAYEAPTAE